VRIRKSRQSALFLILVILVAILFLPINAAQAVVRNIAVTKLIDEPYHKKTFFVITTDQTTYHIVVEANITTVGNETLVQLSATLLNPQNETITASAQIPDTLTDAPYYSGPVEAFHLHLDRWVVTALKIALPIVIVVALVLQVIDILEDYIAHAVLETLKALLFGGPLIYASLPWVMLTLLQDTNNDGSFDMYVPYSPPSPHINLILLKRYFIATSLNWWRIEEHEVYTDIPIPFDGVWHIVWFTYYVAQWWVSRQQSVPLPPTAEFVWRPNQPIVNETVTFTSTSFAPNGTITAYQWWLGDGNQKTVQNFAYTYTQIGEYNVTLKVTDNNGLTGNVTHTVTVQPSAATALRVIPDHLQVSVQIGKNATAQFLVGETLNQSDLLGVTFKALDLSKTFENQTISSGNVTFNRNGFTVAKGTYTNVTVTFHAPLDSPIGWYSGNITVTSANGGNSTIYDDLFVYNPPIAATVDIHPQALNLKSKGKWITCYIELPEGYNVSDIYVSSILLNSTIPVDIEAPTTIGDYDNDTIPDLMVKFNRTLVIEYVISKGITYGNATLTLTGQLYNSTSFEGSDTIKVSGLAGDVNCDGKVDIFDIVQACAGYDSIEEEPNWNSNANFAPPWNRIDIFDLVTITYHYGQKYP